MLKGEKLNFIRCEHRKGVSNNTGKEYEIANVTLSDGLESFTMDIEPGRIPTAKSFSKGDLVNIEVDVINGFNRTRFVVTNIKPAGA